DRRWRSLAEADSTVDLDAARDERVQERACCETRRIFDDVDVSAGAGSGADGAAGGDRTITPFSKGQSRAASCDSTNIGEQWNRAGGRLQHNRRWLASGSRRHRDDNDILIQRQRGHPCSVGRLQIAGKPSFRNLLVVEAGRVADDATSDVPDAL